MHVFQLDLLSVFSLSEVEPSVKVYHGTLLHLDSNKADKNP